MVLLRNSQFRMVYYGLFITGQNRYEPFGTFEPTQNEFTERGRYNTTVDAMRATTFLSRPSEVFRANAEELASTTLFLMARVGPTVFTIKDEQDSTFRVTLGNPHTCSCGTSEDTCVHRLFCLIKVLKVPAEHSLSYQTSLTDNEMDQVLQGLQKETQRPVRNRLVRAIPIVSEEAAKDNFVARQPIVDGEENTCTICMDEMTSTQTLTWCRVGCGQNMHANCMIKCAQFNVANKLSITCPLCRNPMDMAVLKADSKGKPATKNTYAPVQCMNCKCNQREAFYRCVECSQSACTTATGKPYDFCQTCFDRQVESTHASHHFVRSDIKTEAAHGVEWIACKNPASRGILTNPALVRELQGRELGVNDYELLLQLSDGGPAPEFPTLCIESLPFYSKSHSNKKVGPNTQCWCAAALSPSRSRNNIIITSPVTGQATLGPQSPTLFGSSSHAHSPHEDRAMRVLPCQHVAHDRCLREEIRNLVEEDTGKIVNYRCSHLECGKRIFIGLSRNRRRKLTESKGDSGKLESAVALNNQEYGMASGIVGASCFGSTGSSTGGLASSLRKSGSVPRAGRSFSSSPTLDLELGVLSIGSSGINGGSFATGPVNIERIVPARYQQRQQRAQMQAQQQQLPSLSAPSSSLALAGNATGTLRDGGPQFAGAGGLLMTQQSNLSSSGVGASGRRPPVGKRVRLRALGDALRAGQGGGEAVGLQGRAIDAMDLGNDATGNTGRPPRRDSSPALNLSNSFRRVNGIEPVELGSLSDRGGASPAPLLTTSGLQRASSLGARPFPSDELARNAQVKASVQNVLADHVKNNRARNRVRDAQMASVDHNLDLNVMSLSNPGQVMTSGTTITESSGSNNSEKKKPAGRIVRGLRGIARAGSFGESAAAGEHSSSGRPLGQTSGLSIQTGEDLDA